MRRKEIIADGVTAIGAVDYLEFNISTVFDIRGSLGKEMLFAELWKNQFGDGPSTIGVAVKG